MSKSLSFKTFLALTKAVQRPRSSISWIRRGHLAVDKVFVAQTYWFTGALPRVSLSEILPRAKTAEVCLPRVFDRKFGTSVTAEEACHLGAIEKCLDAANVLEIGTFDGNTALALAANVRDGGQIVTVDLPPDFNLQEQRQSLVYSDGEINLTPRDQLASQYRKHPLASRIKQVYGDSASLDWTALGGPFDLIFIDGCHSADYVRSDSQNALRVLKEGGAIVWHDYGMIEDVSNEVDRIAREASNIKVYALEGTRLAMGLSS